VLSYCYSNDAALELRKMQGDTAADSTKFPTPFFKSMTHRLKDRKTVRDAILNLLEHVRKGCLSDVPGINLYRMNPETQKVFCCRGTSSNETDNFFINCITGTSVGIGRCERLLSTFFEVSNERKRCFRMGECKNKDMFFTHRTERLGMINSYTRSSGWSEGDLPFSLPQPAAVTSEEIGNADIGFDAALTLDGVETIGDVITKQNNALQEESTFEEEDSTEQDFGDDVPMDGEGVAVEVEDCINSNNGIIQKTD
jgi:hypothetical protein